MTEERTCRCKGQFAMHKPALHSDRDGSESRTGIRVDEHGRLHNHTRTSGDGSEARAQLELEYEDLAYWIGKPEPHEDADGFLIGRNGSKDAADWTPTKEDK